MEQSTEQPMQLNEHLGGYLTQEQLAAKDAISVGKYYLISRDDKDYERIKQKKEKEPLLFRLFRKIAVWGTLLNLFIVSFLFLIEFERVRALLSFFSFMPPRIGRLLFVITLIFVAHFFHFLFYSFELIDPKNPNKTSDIVFRASFFHWVYVGLLAVLVIAGFYLDDFVDLSKYSITQDMIYALIAVCGLPYLLFYAWRALWK